MPKIKYFHFKTFDGEERRIRLLADAGSPDVSHTTVLTGKNGSYKSSILREIVISAISHSEDLFSESSIELNVQDTNTLGRLHVVACAGTATDRYPAKETGGRSSKYDVPDYVYLGQRVGSNMISRKQSLETAITHLLDESVKERFTWDFYDLAFKFAGVKPYLHLTFRWRQVRDRTQGSTLQWIRDVAEGNVQDTKTRRVASMSVAKARFLLSEFDEETFNAADLFTQNSNFRCELLLQDGAHSQVSLKVIRLGLLSDQLSLADAKVSSSRKSGRDFSVFELSSGEYHMLTTLLGLGFSVRRDSIVLIDEPENSLHPQWQIDFMRATSDIFAIMDDGHVIISTHSPLIVSSAPLNSTVVDVGRSGESITEVRELSGAAADDILLDHFGIASSRNFFMVDKVQRAVELIETSSTASNEFSILLDDLRTIREVIPSDDPFADVLDAILESEGRGEST